MSSVRNQSHDVNCELTFTTECKCLWRDRERLRYGTAKNKAITSLGSLVAKAHESPLSPEEADEIRSDAEALRHAVIGYPSMRDGSGSSPSVTHRRVASDEEVSRMTHILLEAWTHAEPNHLITLYPASFIATFVDMARAALEARDDSSSKS